MRTIRLHIFYAAAVMAISVITLLSAPNVRAAPLVTNIDFEALAGHGVNATAYLAGFGITVSTEPNTNLYVYNEAITYGGGVVDAPSGTQYLSQEGDGTAQGNIARVPPNTFTLTFANPLISFGFSESAILVPSITSPWTATAYDIGNNILDSVSYAGGSLHGVLTFELSGSGIDHVTFVQTAAVNAAFYAANLDDFVLTSSVSEPGSMILLMLTGIGIFVARTIGARRTK